MRFYGLFYVKNEVSAETSLIFYFYCGSVSRETDEKMSIFFQNFLASKVKLADGFMNETGIKLWNRQIRSGKKIETDGTRLRRGTSVSIFFPTESGRFHNFSQFHSWNHTQFHFLKQNQKKMIRHFRQFQVKTTKKKSRFLSKTALSIFCNMLVKIFFQ